MPLALPEPHRADLLLATLTSLPRLRQPPSASTIAGLASPGTRACTPPHCAPAPTGAGTLPAPPSRTSLCSEQPSGMRRADVPAGRGAPRSAAPVQTIGVHGAPGTRRPSQALPSPLLHPPFPAARAWGQRSCAWKGSAPKTRGGDGEGTAPDGGAGKPREAESAGPHLCGALARRPLAAAARRGPPPRAWPGGAPVPPSRCVRTSVPRSLRGHRPSPEGWGCQWMTSGPPRPPAPRVSVRRGATHCGAHGGGSLPTAPCVPPPAARGTAFPAAPPIPLRGKGFAASGGWADPRVASPLSHVGKGQGSSELGVWGSGHFGGGAAAQYPCLACWPPFVPARGACPAWCLYPRGELEPQPCTDWLVCANQSPW